MDPHHDAKRKARELTRQNGMPYAVNLAQVVREMTTVKAPSAAPYSTGGGGTVLEHRFGALMQSHLLTSRPVPALGDHITPWDEARQGAPLITAGRAYVTSSSGKVHALALHS